VSLERIERKSGGVGVWRVRWRDEVGREHSKVIGRKADAEAFEAEVVRRKRTGDLDLLRGAAAKPSPSSPKNGGASTRRPILRPARYAATPGSGTATCCRAWARSGSTR
jgi:hypothetical protein